MHHNVFALLGMIEEVKENILKLFPSTDVTNWWNMLNHVQQEMLKADLVQRGWVEQVETPEEIDTNLCLSDGDQDDE